LLGTPTSHPIWVEIAEVGGISGNDTLEVGETWIYQFVHDVTQADLASRADGNFVFGGTPAQLPPGGANGALFFSGTDLPATGSGLIDPFVRIQAKDTEQGYNTDARPYDANNDAGATATFNHSIQLSAVPLVEISGVRYREFRLDLNETNNGGKRNLITLDALKLFSADAGNLIGLDTTVGAVGATTAFSSGRSKLLYNLDGAGDISVLLTDWSTGSGHGDYAVLIPEAAFADVAENQFIYLYSAFGDTDGTNGGFEEWYLRSPATIDNTATVTATVAESGGTVSDSAFVSVPLVQTVDVVETKLPTPTTLTAPADTVPASNIVVSAAVVSQLIATATTTLPSTADTVPASNIVVSAAVVPQSIPTAAITVPSTADTVPASNVVVSAAVVSQPIATAAITLPSNLVLGTAPAQQPATSPVQNGHLGGLSTPLTAGTAGESKTAAPPAEQPVAQRSSSLPSPNINWDNRIDTKLASGSSASSQIWLDDFLNHLGQNESQRNPNAALRIKPGQGVHP
jgi:hypothetical protein